MTERPDRLSTPRLLHAGAFVILAGIALVLGSPSALVAQIPPDSLLPDSLAADSLAVDSLSADSLLALQVLDSARVADSLRADSLHIDNFPTSRRGEPEGLHTGVWEWDRDELLWAQAFTLSDLLATVPGLLTLRGGDYGMPVGVTAFGVTGGRVRVLSDGIERIPYEGGSMDLSQISLAGVDYVRVRRSPGGILVELETLRFDDARAYSQIDVGTGDLQTNMFRGTFGLPHAAGGSALASLERVDTRGAGQEEPGALSEVWIRYGLSRGARGGVEFDYRRRSQDRGELFSPAQLKRREWSVRGRVRLTEGVLFGGHFAKTGLEGENALTGDTTTAESVREIGGGLWVDRGAFWANATIRGFSGRGMPGSVQEVMAGIDDDRVGGVVASYRRESWDGRSLGRTSLRAWTAPRYHAFLFAEVDRGQSGIPFLAYLEPPVIWADSLFVPTESGLRVDDRSTRRVGVGFGWRGLDLEAARVSVDADSVFPLGFTLDRGPTPFPGGSRDGYEAVAVVPLPIMDGLTFQGSVVKWDVPDAPAPDSGEVAPVIPDDAWPYLPRLTYDARLHYRRAFLPTGNFELQVDLGVREREAMRVFQPVDTIDPVDPIGDEDDPGPLLPPTEIVRFHQNWYARLEMQIVSLKVFVEWENLSVRRERADFPGRVLPVTRAVYGVRWTLLN